MHVNDDGFDLFDLSTQRDSLFDLRGASLLPLRSKALETLREKGRVLELEGGRWRWKKGRRRP